jgi:carbon-monoxide dehydrogenase small subunit
MKKVLQLKVNGRLHKLEVEPSRLLLDALREDLGLMGAKRGCGEGYCGCCSVLLDGKAVHSCCVLAMRVAGREITTIEGLAVDKKLDPLQEAFVARGASQCGYCSPGMILSAKALLSENPHPTEEQVRVGLAGNLCRCTGYHKIMEAVLSVASAAGERSL